jgi:hypothetical protein
MEGVRPVERDKHKYFNKKKCLDDKKLSLRFLSEKASNFSFLWDISSFSGKIEQFDVADWEREVYKKQKFKKLNLSKHSKRKSKRGRDLIDLDLVRGSAFVKVKPPGYYSRLNRNFFRVFIFPLYRRWWTSELTAGTYFVCSFTYVFHVACILACVALDLSPTISPLEVFFPVGLLALLSLLYASIVASAPNQHSDPSFIRRQRNKRKKPQKYSPLGIRHPERNTTSACSLSLPRRGL